MSIVHASGFSHLNTETAFGGVGLAGGEVGVAVGGAQTTGTQQTSLSSNVAPPAQRQATGRQATAWGCGTVVGGIIVASAVGSFGIFWAGAVVGLVVWVLAAQAEQQDAKKWNATEWPSLKARWDRSLMCMRCGKIWELTGAEGGARVD